MRASELKNKFINFFVAQKHIEIPSANLTPENDPTTLFISAGMHPLVPYLLGQPHPLGKRLVDVQNASEQAISTKSVTKHTTHFLKCLAIGVLVIILKKKLLLGVLNF